MKRSNRTLSIICTMLLLLLIVAVTTAAVPSEEMLTPHTEMRMSCYVCGDYAPITCNGDCIRGDSGSHTYNITKTCIFTDYTSTSESKCWRCGTVCETFGEHWCWRVHGSCGREYESCCPCPIYDGVFGD